MTPVNGSSLNVSQVLGGPLVETQVSPVAPLLTAFLALLPSFVLAVTLPPLWQHSDSMILLFGQITVALPHYPILYPMTSWVISGLFGYSSEAVIALLIVQHTLLTLGLYYCLSAVPRLWQRVVVAVALFLGMRGHIFSHGILTEAFGFGFLLIFLGAFIRIALRGDFVGRSGTRDVWVYHGALALMCLSRAAFASLALCLPAYFIVRFLVSRERRRSGFQVLIGLAAGVAALVVASVVTTVVLRAVGASTEPVVGRAGVYRIQSLPWNEMTEADRADLIQRAQANAKSDFVAQIIPVLVTTPEPWVGPWQAVDKIRLKQGVAIGTDAAMSAALMAFLETMDRRLIAAISGDVMRYITAHGQIAKAIEYAPLSVDFYRTSVDWPLARTIPAIVDNDPSRYELFLGNFLIRIVDAIPNYVPYGLAILTLTIQLVLWCAGSRTLWTIRSEAMIAAATLLTAGLAYVVLCCVVNIITPYALRYTIPLSGLGWTAVALLIISSGPRPIFDSHSGR